MFIIDRTGKIFKANEAAAGFYGYEKTELESKYIYEINTIPKEKVLSIIEKIINKNQNVFVFRHRLKSGQIKHVQVYSSPAGIGGKEYLLSIIHDITHEARYHKIFSSIKEISQTLVNIRSEEELFKSLTRALVERAGFKIAFVMIPNRRNTKLVSVEYHGSDIMNLEYVKTKAVDLTSSDNGHLDPQAASFLEGRVVIGFGAAMGRDINNPLSSVCIPLLKNNKPVGCFCILHDEPDFFEGFIDLFEDIKNTVSLSLKRLSDEKENEVLRNELAESETLFRTLADQMQSGLAMYKEKFIYTNPAFQRMLGYTEEELKDLGAVDMIADDFKDNVRVSVKKGLSDVNDRRYVELKAVKKNGEEFWIYANAGSVRYKGEVVRITNIQDTSEMVNLKHKLEMEKEIFRELSHMDSLTEVGNRRAFDSNLESHFDLARRHGRPLSLIMIDIDHFKHVNDIFSHRTGDIVLKDIADITKAGIRKSDFLARYGGEEFAIIAPETPLSMAEVLAEKIRLKVNGFRFCVGQPVTISLGVASLNDDDTLNTLLFRADMALYKAKECGRNCTQIIS